MKHHVCYQTKNYNLLGHENTNYAGSTFFGSEDMRIYLAFKKENGRKSNRE